MLSSRAILIRKIRFSDSSLILTWLGENTGLLRTMARGVRKGTSKLIAGADLFAEAEITVAPSPRSELHQLRECKLIDSHERARRTYAGLLVCSYFAELMELTVEPSASAPEYFDLFHRALVHLDSRDPSERAVEHFEVSLCGLLGHAVPRPGNAADILMSHAGRAPRLRDRTIAALRMPSEPTTLPAGEESPGDDLPKYERSLDDAVRGPAGPACPERGTPPAPRGG